MSIMELGALGEFLGVFALVATLIYLAMQVRLARNESEKAVLEAKTTGIRELSLTQAASDGLTAALVKAEEAIGAPLRPFEAELISHGLNRQEARRVNSFYQANWRHDRMQYETDNQESWGGPDGRLRAVYTSGLGRLYSNLREQDHAFAAHVNRLKAEADQESQQ